MSRPSASIQTHKAGSRLGPPLGNDSAQCLRVRHECTGRGSTRGTGQDGGARRVDHAPAAAHHVVVAHVPRRLQAPREVCMSVPGSWGKHHAGRGLGIRNGDTGAVRLPKILVLTCDASNVPLPCAEDSAMCPGPPCAARCCTTALRMALRSAALTRAFFMRRMPRVSCWSVCEEREG